MDSAGRRISLGLGGDLYPEGGHICGLYGDARDRKRILRSFVHSGLDAGEAVEYVADVASADDLERVLHALGIVAPDAAARCRLTVRPTAATYFPDGHFAPGPMLEHLRDTYVHAIAEARAGARLAGEMTWALRGVPGAERLPEYEARINELVESHPVTVLCQYDTSSFDGATIFAALAAHPMLIVRGQILRNPFYVPAPRRSRAAGKPSPAVPRRVGHRNGSPGQAQADVLGRLLIVQQILDVLPDEVRIAEFTRRALLSVPGVADVHVCLGGRMIPPDVRFQDACTRCDEMCSTPAALDADTLAPPPDTRYLLIQTESHSYGMLIIRTGDEELLRPYVDFLSNVAKAIAMILGTRRYEAKLREVMEEEHQRKLARDLHDEIGQSLAALKVHLVSGLRELAFDALQTEMQRSAGLVDRAIQQVRRLSRGQHPVQLDEFGLAAALRSYFEQEARLAGLALRVDAPDLHAAVAPEVEIACFRVAQEALSNTIKHARARHVWLELKATGAQLELRVRDDGNSFEADAALRHAAGDADVGLLSLRERVEQVGGTLERGPAPTGGMEVRALFPLGVGS